MNKNSLKVGWQTLKFGEIAENIAIRVKPSESDSDIYVGLEHLAPETLHLKEWGQPSDVEGDKLRFWKGDIIFGRRRAYQRKLAIAEFDGICSAHAMVLRAKPKAILPEFLPFFLQSDLFMERAIGISVGSLSPTINWKTLREEEFPLPSLEEQKRITEILWAADESVEHYIEVKHGIVLLRGKFFIEKCLLGLTQQKMNNLNLTDHGWPIKRIIDCIKISSRKSAPPHKSAEYIGLEHIDSGGFHTTNKGSSKSVKSACSIYERGDLLYGKLRPNLDKAVIADSNGVCSTEILVITAKEITSNRFLLYHFHCPKFVSYNAHRAFGTKMPRTSMEIIGNYRIPVPQRETQANLLARLETLTNQEGEIDRHISTLKAVQLNYLNRIMNGESRV